MFVAPCKTVEPVGLLVRDIVMYRIILNSRLLLVMVVLVKTQGADDGQRGGKLNW